MDKEVEKWIEELLKNGTFESKEDIYEFCVYAVKIACETTDTNQQTLTERIIIGKEHTKTNEEKIPRPMFPIKLKNWKEYMKKGKELIQNISNKY